MNKDLLEPELEEHNLKQQDDSIIHIHEIEQQENKEQSFHSLDKVIQNNWLKVEMKQTEGYLRGSFTTQQNAHLNNSIRFADTKAGALVGMNGLVLTYVTNLISSATGYSDLCFKLSLLFLIASILYSFSVVYPRVLNSKAKGLVYWEHITNCSKDEYVQVIVNGSTEAFLSSAVENNYAQAVILTKKFKKLSIGFKLGIVAYILITIGLLIKVFL